MRKMNKKGFTLAELLIVIAIIAILIAIAIPAFSGALESAKIQTDHANMRAAYSVAQTANMIGTIDVTTSTTSGGTTTTTTTTTDVSKAANDTVYVFMKDGTIAASGSTGYVTQTGVKKSDTRCSASIPCTDLAHNANGHAEGAAIQIKKVEGKWIVILNGGTAVS